MLNMLLSYHMSVHMKTKESRELSTQSKVQDRIHSIINCFERFKFNMFSFT